MRGEICGFLLLTMIKWMDAVYPHLLPQTHPFDSRGKHLVCPLLHVYPQKEKTSIKKRWPWQHVFQILTTLKRKLGIKTMKQGIILMKQTIVLVSIIITSNSSCCEAFCPQASIPSSSNRIGKVDGAIALRGWFDGFGAGGSGKDNLDEEWEKQQEILKFRRSSQGEREKYFQGVSFRW